MIPERHRNLYNADCNAFFYKYHPKSYWYYPDGARFSAKNIHRFIDVLAANGVDTLLVNTNAQRAWYPSKVVQTNLDGYTRGDKTYFFGHLLGQPMTKEQLERYLTEMTVLMDRYLDLVEDGVNWVEEAARACRRNRISPWLSIRMNDMHGATLMPEFSLMNCKLFADPKMRLRGMSNNPREPFSIGWQGFNYEKVEVRNFMMALIKECIEDFDYEGIELDWTRTPMCCEPGASKKTRSVITDWHEEIRALTREKARKTGRPFYVGIRYSGTFDQLETIGLDIRAMARKDIIDFVCPTNTWQTSWDIPLDEIKEELGPNVAVYGVIENAPNWLMTCMKNQKPHPFFPSNVAQDYRLSSASAAVLRGNAASKLVLGAHGIETFNFFCTDTAGHWPWEEVDCHADYPALKNLENLDFLRGKPKFYAFSSKAGVYQNLHFETIGEFPVVLEPECRHEALLPMASEKGSDLSLTIQVVIEKHENVPDIGISLNGSWPNFNAKPTQELLVPVGGLTHHVPYHQAFNYSFKVSDIREGWNSIVLINGSHKRSTYEERKADSVCVVSLELAVM